MRSEDDRKQKQTTDDLEESDLALLHALQISPRATWTDLAGPLGATPSSLARRWAALASSGLAWTTVHPLVDRGSRQLAFVEVDCDPAHRDAVVTRLCEMPEVLTLEVSARGRDLLLTVVAEDWRSLGGLVLDHLQFTGVLRFHTTFVTKVHVEASAWRLDALEPATIAALGQRSESATPRRATEAAYDRALAELLALDARISFAEMARRTGRSTTAVRRRFTQLTGSGLLSFRCEMSQLTARRPVSCNWFCRVPARQLDACVTALRTLPELRGCFSITGEANLLLIVWARSVTDLLRIEQQLSQAMPMLDFLDSSIALRTPKRIGWLLDDEGRSTGRLVVPTALRSSTTPA